MGRGANSASSTPVSCGVRSVEEEREVMARNTLFLAVTRPALFAGIPIEAAVVILLTSVITLIGTTNPVYGLVVAAVMFGISRLVVRHDVNAFRLRSEEHTSELQSLLRTSYAVFCLKNKKVHTKRSIYNYIK